MKPAMAGARRQLFVLALLALGCGTMTRAAEPAAPAANRGSPMKDIRFVIVHSPGPKWEPGKSMFEQDGLQAHVDHYRQLFADGKLALGGPFMDASGGGMMIPMPGVSQQELEAFAQADPSVRSGLLKAEVRPWLVGMQK